MAIGLWATVLQPATLSRGELWSACASLSSSVVCRDNAGTGVVLVSADIAAGVEPSRWLASCTGVTDVVLLLIVRRLNAVVVLLVACSTAGNLVLIIVGEASVLLLRYMLLYVLSEPFGCIGDGDVARTLKVFACMTAVDPLRLRS